MFSFCLVLWHCNFGFVWYCNNDRFDMKFDPMIFHISGFVHEIFDYYIIFSTM